MGGTIIAGERFGKKDPFNFVSIWCQIDFRKNSIVYPEFFTAKLCGALLANHDRRIN